MITIVLGAYILGVGLFSIIYPLGISTFWPLIFMGWIVGFFRGIAEVLNEQKD